MVFSLNDDLTRATDVMIVGKLASVCGCGKAGSVALRDSGACVSFAESDPFCAVLVLAFCLPNVTPSAPCRRALKVSAVVRNTAHFDNEIDSSEFFEVLEDGDSRFSLCR